MISTYVQKLNRCIFKARSSKKWLDCPFKGCSNDVDISTCLVIKVLLVVFTVCRSWNSIPGATCNMLIQLVTFSWSLPMLDFSPPMKTLQAGSQVDLPSLLRPASSPPLLPRNSPTWALRNASSKTSRWRDPSSCAIFGSGCSFTNFFSDSVSGNSQSRLV